MRLQSLAATAVFLLPCSLLSQWAPVQTTNTPPAREDALLAGDLPNARMLMFGGNWSNDFWALENGTWTQLQPTTLPPARRYSALASYWLTGELIIYGGQGPTRYALDDTWVWNGTDWSAAQAATTPGGLMRHGIAYDQVRAKTVLFGGHNDSWNQYQQSFATWEFDGATWSLTVPPSSPPARINPAMCYHPALGKVLLFGGEDVNGDALNDGWTYDGTDWAQINIGLPGPPARTRARLVEDSARTVVLLVGGYDIQNQQLFNDTWLHDGAGWSQVTKGGALLPARLEPAIAFDFFRNRVVAFGGKTANNALRSDTYEFGANWVTLGVGCVGTAGRPELTGGSLPNLGGTCNATLSNVPVTTPLCFLASGFSKQQWAFGPLPVLLGGFGMPGCRAYTSSILISALPTTNGTGQWSWTIPSSTDFFGVEVYMQAMVLDPGVNAAGATVSNALTAVLGW